MRKLQSCLTFQSTAVRSCHLADFRTSLKTFNPFYDSFTGLKILIPIIIFLSSNPFSAQAQLIPDGHHSILQTNLLQTRNWQQFTVSLERKIKNKVQTNTYTLGHNLRYNYEDRKYFRKSFYAMYERRFYLSPPILDYLHFYIAPYGKLVYRDANEGFHGFFLSGYDFRSVSLVGGGKSGVQCNIFKRVPFGISGGLGIGAVLHQESYEGLDAANMHLDGQLLIHIGYLF